MKVRSFPERLEWLKEEVLKVQPNLVVIDLLWQFVVAKNANDYNAVLDTINFLQDMLRDSGYKGALVVAMHARKATNPADPFDDVLGSTGQRGSFSTIIMLTHRRGDGLSVYTVSSDQTERDDSLGEIPETVITKSPEGTLQLGQTFQSLAKQEKKNRFETDLCNFVLYVEDHPGVEIDTMMRDLGMSKKHLLNLLAEGTAFVRREGSGIKGDPYRYFPADDRAAGATAEEEQKAT